MLPKRHGHGVASCNCIEPLCVNVQIWNSKAIVEDGERSERGRL